MKKLVIATALLFLNKPMSVQANELPTLRFLDEYIIPSGLIYNNTTVGGISSIDFVDGHYYLISDHGGGKRSGILGSPRFYKANIAIRDEKIAGFDLLSVHNLQAATASTSGVDPESLRVTSNQHHFIWTSEGSVKSGINPAVNIAISKGGQLATESTMTLPCHLQISKQFGPRHNAVFEGLSLDTSGKGIWVAMEGPLKQDGDEPSKEEGALVRFSYFGLDSKQLEKQFAYYLESLPNEPLAKDDAFRTTGVVEILQLTDGRFIVMERAYTSGLEDGGNRVVLYLVDAKDATNTREQLNLNNQPIVLANKKKLLDLEDIRLQTKSKRIDNLEGLTLGPKLANGNSTLLLVSDDNFNQFGKQISQILLFEIDGI